MEYQRLIVFGYGIHQAEGKVDLDILGFTFKRIKFYNSIYEGSLIVIGIIKQDPEANIWAQEG